MDSLEQYLGDAYELVDTLKPNSVAVVYDKRAKRLCVMKRRDLNCLPIYRTLKELNNPHVPQIYRLIEFDGKLIVIEEHIDGQTLEELKTYRPEEISEQFAEKILIQLCEGLAIFHAQKIIHRDLKPSNIMLTEKNFVKIIDFGIARTFKSDSSEDTELLGTRGYAPPEQFGLFNFGQTDARSDIYSLGVMMKNLLGEDYDGRLRKILDKCTALEPARRFQSVKELCRAIFFCNRYFLPIKIFLLLAVGLSVYFFESRLPAVEAPSPAEEFLDETRGEFKLSLGKLKLGDSAEVMRKIFGREDRITPSKTPGHSHYEYKNIVVTFDDREIVGIVSYSDELQTERGIHQGSALAEVIAAYGQRAAVYEDDGLTLYEYPYESANGNLAVMRFAVKNNCVEYISLRLSNDERHILADVKTL